MSNAHSHAVIRSLRTLLPVLPMVLLWSCAHKPRPTDEFDTSRNQMCKSPLDNLEMVVVQPEPLPAGFEDRTRTVEGKNPDFNIQLSIPVMSAGQPGAEAYNRCLDSLVLLEQMEFLRNLDPVPDPDWPSSNSSLALSHRSVQEDSGLVSVRLPFFLYHAGAAHPLSTNRTMVFDRKAGHVLSLQDLFLPDAPWLETLSARCTAELSARLKDSFFPEGAEPRPGNFERWLLDREALTLLFDPYQVAPWSEGPQEVQIPLTELDSLLAPGIAKP